MALPTALAVGLAVGLLNGFGVAFLRIPSMVLVGADDTRRDGAFNRSRHIDRQQGRTRVERGRHWVAAMRSAARTAGLDTAFEFATLDGCGHSFGDCARHAGLVERALAFLLARPRPLATMTAGGKRAGRR